MTVQSKELTYFYRQYKAWLDNGAPDEQPFHRSCGLCVSVEDILQGAAVHLVEQQLAEQFVQAGLSKGFPFGEDNYEERCADDTQHLDPMRIKWVEDHLKPEFTGEY